MKAYGRIRLTRTINKSRLKILLCLILLCFLLHRFLPKIWKKLPLGYFGIGLRYDEDFQPRMGVNGQTRDGLQLQRKSHPLEIIILIWTAWWWERDPVKILNADDNCSFLKFGTFQRKGRSAFDIPCRISFDRRYLEYSDALVFHSYDLSWDKLPARPNPSQLWVYEQGESPIYTRLNLHKYPDTFNWTMTYRRDSEVYDAYGIFALRSGPPFPFQNISYSTNDDRKLLTNKNRMAAWIVSSCDSHSKRENLVKELQKYINVDIYGWCGADCPAGNCYAGVQSTHKFYLAFENSLCTDYITEKFFKALKTDMVPVVYGGMNTQDYSEIAPKHSYIDARSFHSPKELASYLIYLDQNDEEYLKYFEWKKRYHVVTKNVGFCNLCQEVYEHAKRSAYIERTWYKDVWKWWNYLKDYRGIEEKGSRSLSPEKFAKLNGTACVTPSTTFLGNVTTKADFEPGILNGRIFGKLLSSAKEAIF